MNKRNWLKLASRILAMYGVVMLTTLEDQHGARFAAILSAGMAALLYLIICYIADGIDKNARTDGTAHARKI